MSISLREMQLTAGQATVEDLDGAKLTFDTLKWPATVVVPCVHGPIIKNFMLMDGRSSETMIGFCDFRAALFEGIADDSVIIKGLHCILRPTPRDLPMGLQLWDGGLLPGGAIYKFRLVDENFKG